MSFPIPGLGGVVRAPVPEGVKAGGVVAEQNLPRHVVHQAAAARLRAERQPITGQYCVDQPAPSVTCRAARSAGVRCRRTCTRASNEGPHEGGPSPG